MWQILFFLCFILLPCRSIRAAEIRGSVSFEPGIFTETGSYPGQRDENLSGAGFLHLSHISEDRKDIFDFEPFGRIDRNDPRRTHADIRELSWIRVWQDWELRLGVRRVFWGVIESQHLVDVINQTDLVENIDGEDKLGQPMLNLARVGAFGTVDFFLLPVFRERTFPGSKARFRSFLPVETGSPTYESRETRKHPDVSIRWSDTVGDWDLGVYWFKGTSREPRLRTGVNDLGETVYKPHYFLMNQIGLESQNTWNNFLFKFEGIYRDTLEQDHLAISAGVEHTLFSALGASDVGTLLEYHFDDRGRFTSTGFQNDLFGGFRLRGNDEQSTEILAGLLWDLDNSSKSASIEAKRRLSAGFTLSLEIRAFWEIAANDLFYTYRNDDYIQAELSYFF